MSAARDGLARSVQVRLARHAKTIGVDPRQRLRAYSRASVMAEKLHAMVVLGSANSRMKDYFDVHALLREGACRPAELSRAISATFDRRGTARPDSLPLGLTDDFAREPSKQAQWHAFLDKNRLEAPHLEQVVADIRRLIADALRVAGREGSR
jgi:hypothetical protein